MSTRLTPLQIGARTLGAALWLLALLLFLFWLAPHAHAQGKAQTLCTPVVNSSGNITGCVPVGATGVSTAPWGWLPVGGVANAAAPTYSEGKLGGLSFDLSGNARVTGTFTPSGSSPEFTPVAPATATATAGVLNGCQYNSTQETLTNGQQAAVSCSARGAFIVAPGADGFVVTGTFFQATQPVSVASAQVASGAYASGSLASGAMVDLVALSAPVAPATATATKSILTGCQATTAAVNPTTGQQASCSNDTNNNLLVSSGGAPNLATAQVSVTTGNITVAASRALRRSVMITNDTGTGKIYCGNTGVTTSTGDAIAATAGSFKQYSTTAAIFCTVASVTQTVTVAETY